MPAFVPFEKAGDKVLDDRWLHGAEGRKHPAYRPRPRIRLFGQQAGMVLGYMEDDGTGFEQNEIALFIGRNLPERLKREMLRFLHRLEREKAHIIWLAHLFQRPTNAHVAGEALAAVG